MIHRRMRGQPANSPSLLSTSTHDQLVVLGEVVRGDLQVERRGALAYAARDVVVRAVARAEPASEVAGLADGDASEMCADAW